MYNMPWKYARIYQMGVYMNNLICRLESKLNEYKEMIKLLPEDNIYIRNRIAKRQGEEHLETTYVVLLKDTKNPEKAHEHRLSKGVRDASLIQRLLQKKSLKRIIPNLEYNLKTMKQCQKKLKPIDEEEIVFSISQLRFEKEKDLLFEKTGKIHEIETIEEIELTELQEYYPDDLWNAILERQNDYHIENLCIGNKRYGYYRSKSEYIIAGMLMDAGIEFKYEPCIVHSKKKMYPDFIIRSKKHSRLFLWEHAGMMKNDDYRSSMLIKLDDYAKEGLYPMESLILSYDMLNGNLNMDTIQYLIDFVK